MDNKAKLIYGEVKKSLKGKDAAVKKAVIALIADGHLLLEDIPGVGKTTLSKAIAAAVGLETKRVQFTPDTLPSDITGFTMWDAERGKFRFHSGAVMTNILLADEINRTSPRTQSALLQAMEEKCVSEEGNTFALEPPFMVIATQNPLGSAGTMPLPPSQLDRFMMRISIGRPTKEELAQLILKRAADGEEQINAVCGKAELLEMQKNAAAVYLSEPIAEWIAQLVESTHTDSLTEQGLSPRGAIALMKAAKASAYFDCRDFVLPSDISDLFADVAAHRLILSPKAAASETSAERICENILRDNPPPHTKRAGR
jgi:MoxR-like ATPase